MMKEKICGALTKLWGVAALVLTLLGGLTVIGFVVALVIGGGTGEAIAVFIQKKLFAVMINMTCGLIVLGWIKMELNGEKALTGGLKKAKKG